VQYFFKLLNSAFSHRWNFYIALTAVALYLLHPANAETVNYIIARSDIQSTFLVILGFCLYMYSPFFKKTFLYLLPVAIGVLAKPPAAMFAPLFFLYVLLFEEKMSIMAVFKKKDFKQFFSVVKTALPAFIVCGLMYLLVDRLTPKTWIPGGSSTFNYLITQPSVIVHYFTTFFLPISLSADTDWVPLETIWDASFFIGCAFIIVLLFIAFKFSKDEKLRPISFGILWFFLALLPTSVIPLSEVLNDHRIFFPYVGLTIAVCHTVSLILLSFKKQIDALFANKAILIACLLIVLGGYAYGTHQRNNVWHTEESFHAHDSNVQINTSNSAEEEQEGDEENDEDEPNLSCTFPKKDIPFTYVNFKERLISIHSQPRLSKPFLKPQFTPPDFILIA
jgi:hypothetical protein